MRDQATIDAVMLLLRLPEYAAKLSIGYMMSGAPSDRLALARTLVADMPGVMCGVVPERKPTPEIVWSVTFADTQTGSTPAAPPCSPTGRKTTNREAREELVEMAAKAIAGIRIGDSGDAWEVLSAYAKNVCRKDARAALAVIEPVVREECAKVADQWIPAGHLRVDTARQIAEAIRAIRGGSNGG